MNSQNAASVCLVMTCGRENLLDVETFHLAKAYKLVSRGRNVRGRESDGMRFDSVITGFLGQIGRSNVTGRRENHRPLNHILKFANVAWPRITLQQIGRGWSQSRELLAQFAIEMLQHLECQRQNILF